jgi:hypothetical protein
VQWPRQSEPSLPKSCLTIMMTRRGRSTNLGHSRRVHEEATGSDITDHRLLRRGAPRRVRMLDSPRRRNHALIGISESSAELR